MQQVYVFPLVNIGDIESGGVIGNSNGHQMPSVIKIGRVGFETSIRNNLEGRLRNAHKYDKRYLASVPFDVLLEMAASLAEVPTICGFGKEPVKKVLRALAPAPAPSPGVPKQT
jgi:hypothetical protein